jgi:DNA primase
MSRVKVAKYLTSMGASRAGILINLDTAVAASLKQGWDRAVVLCEGMLDAVRVGAMGVPLLGKSLSQEQSRILKAHCDRVVILLDADAQEDAKKIENELKGLKVNIVTIPGVKDPGDATTDVIWTEIGKVTGLNFNPIAI